MDNWIHEHVSFFRLLFCMGRVGVFIFYPNYFVHSTTAFSFKGDWKKCWYVYFLPLNKLFTAEKLEMRVQKWRNGRNTSSLSISASEKKILLFYLGRSAKALLQVYRGKKCWQKKTTLGQFV